MATKYRLVPEKTLLLLIENSLRLNALESGGVDNWTWYGESCHDVLEPCSQDIGRDIEDLEELADIDLAAYPEIEIEEGD